MRAIYRGTHKRKTTLSSRVGIIVGLLRHVCKNSLSVVLAFTMILSVCAISGFSYSNLSAATSGNIYYKNTNNWSTPYAYAWAGETKYTGTWPGTAMEKVSGTTDVYKISLSSDATNIIFSDGSNNKTTDLTLPESYGQIYNNGTWSVYDQSQPQTTNSTYEYDAKTSDSFNSSDVAFKANCSLYDYLDDQELSTGKWGNVKAAGNSTTWYPFDSFNSMLSSYYSTNNVNNGIYFGNFNTGSKTETDRQNTYNNKKSSLVNYNIPANNSKAVYYDSINYDVNNTGTLANYGDPASWAYSYQGLVSKNLNNGQLMVPTSGGSVEAPFFNDSFLKKTSGQTNIGRKVNTILPFSYSEGSHTYSYQSSTVTTHASPINGIYLSNSQNGGSTNNLNAVTSDSLTMNYGGTSTSKGILDGKQWFNSGSSGYGFFPFNNNTISHTSGDVRNDLDYGFGMALDLKFTIPDNGCVPNTTNPIEFNFTGDDDVWIFIDGKLVVDLGGDHKDASCTLNFKNNTTNISTGINNKAVGTENKAYTLADVMNGSNSNVIHKMKVFYMERGLIESNLKLSFSFDPIDNLLTTDKSVDTADVNAGLKDALASDDTFYITNKNESDGNVLTSDGVIGSNKITYNADKSYNIKDKQTSSFTNIATTGKNLSVTESNKSKYNNLTYDTTYKVTDVTNSIEKASGSGKSTGSFAFTSETTENPDAETHYNVKFTNKPAVNDVSVLKTAYYSDGKTKDSSTEYGFNIKVALDGSTNYQPYNLKYYLGTDTTNIKTATNGTFKLIGGQKATFVGIPVGATYKIVENDNTSVTTINGVSSTDKIYNGTVLSSTNEVEYVNTKYSNTPAEITLGAKKTIDGNTPTDKETFEFNLTEINASGEAVSGGVSDNTTNEGSNVEFNKITYPLSETPTTPTEPTTAKPTVAPTTVAPTTVAPTTAPKTTKTIYVKPNNYANDSAALAVYAFGGSQTATWYKLTQIDSSSIYSAEMDKSYTTIIVARFPSTTTDFNFTNKWNQTSDQTIPANNDLFTINNGEWDNAGGTWSSFANNDSAEPMMEDAEPVLLDLTNEPTVTYHYYKISEKQGTDSDVNYDNTAFYAKVAVVDSLTSHQAYKAYFSSFDNAKNASFSTSTNTFSGSGIISQEQVVFKNSYKKGSVTIYKYRNSDTTDENLLKGAEFELHKTTSDGGADAGIVSQALTTGDDGKVTFDNISLFTENGNATPTATDKEYQWYYVEETKAPSGFAINKTKYYFKLPMVGKYDITYKYTDYGVIMPSASGNGMNMFLVVGLIILLSGVLTIGGYSLLALKNKYNRQKHAKSHFIK